MTAAAPAQYQPWVQKAASMTGLPQAVVAAQINQESGFNPRATSPTGAEGIAQIEPATWRSLGIPGNPYNPDSALLGYSKYMRQLLAQEHGNVRDALAAYNAGPANLPAGYGYADTILASAGKPGGTTAGAASGAQSGTSGGPDWAKFMLDLAFLGLGVASFYRGTKRVFGTGRQR